MTPDFTVDSNIDDSWPRSFIRCLSLPERFGLIAAGLILRFGYDRLAGCRRITAGFHGPGGCLSGRSDTSGHAGHVLFG